MTYQVLQCDQELEGKFQIVSPLQLNCPLTMTGQLLCAWTEPEPLRAEPTSPLLYHEVPM